ncbi:MAG: pantoate--beta-alanine ligase [Bacteroidales bacterium]|nr:pantoate--beta-alanine ligase [Bacteroidales bacterium]MBO5847331.1 pantoate--beta-alanine ligase [Bacteroidales bacterium]
MEIIKSIAQLKSLVAQAREAKKSIGLVPTMGALHAGHISLVNRCVAENEVCVVSVFVNPTQFNDKSDLAAYPRTPEQDAAMLEKAGCDIVFMPEVEEMYPEPDTRQFSFGALEQVMEGPYRPGHFNGVAQIVSKLFYAVEPDLAYFGEKDFQQVAIIREMVKQLQLPVKIVSCPIVREADGLAMSSRNQRLNEEERKKSVLISKYLFESRTFAGEKSLAETKAFVEENIGKVDIFRLDYFEIVDGYTLQPVKNWEDADYVVGCIAVFCGPVRLIDNIIYKS